MAVKKNLLLNKSAVMKVVFVVSLALFFTRVVPGCEASDSDESSSSAAEEAPGAHPSGARPRSAGQPGGTGQRSTPSKIPKQPRTSSSFQQTYTLPAPLHEPGVESQRRRAEEQRREQELLGALLSHYAGGDGSVSSGFGGMYVDPEGVDEIIQEGLLAEALRQEEEDARRGRRRSSGLGPLWLLDPGPGRGQEQPLGSQFMEGRPRIVPVSQPPRLPQQHVAAAKGLRFASDREELERLQARQAAAAAYQKSRKQRTPDDEERGGRPIITTVIGDSEVPFDRVRPTQRSIANAKLASQLEEIRAAKKAAYKQQPLAPESGGGRGPGIHHKLAVVGVTVMAVVVASILVFKLADRIFGKAKDEGKPAQKPAKRRRRRQVSSPVFRARPGNEQALFYAPRRNIFGGDAAALEDTLAQQEPLPVFGGASPESQASSGLPTENGNGMRSF